MQKRVPSELLDDFLNKYKTLRHLTKKEIRSRLGARGRTATPFFVVGAGRSGTSMLINVLGRSLDTKVYSEYDRRAFDNFRLRDLAIIRKLVDACRYRVIVFKPLQDSHRLLELLNEFENSKSVWIYRNYKDVVNSTVAKWGNWERGIKDLDLLSRGEGRWSERISTDTYEFFRSNYREGVSVEDAVCLNWYLRNIQYMEMTLNTASNVMLINYERLVGQPKKIFFLLFQFAGCEYLEEYSEDVFTTSIKKQPSPTISVPIAERCEWLSHQLENCLIRE